jgi:hypothetical protein
MSYAQRCAEKKVPESWGKSFQELWKAEITPAQYDSWAELSGGGGLRGFDTTIRNVREGIAGERILEKKRLARQAKALEKQEGPPKKKPKQRRKKKKNNAK